MIDWDRVDTVLLDMDGTLLDLGFDNYFWLEYLPAHVAGRDGNDPDAVRAELHATYDRMRGTLQWYCLDYWSEALDVDIRQLKRQIAHRIRLRPGTLEFLAWLERLGKRRILVTNAHPGSLELKLEVTDLGDYLDEIYSSHQFGFPKESAEFWRALVEQTPVQPARCLFVDDTDAILAAAERFGIGHLLHISQPDLSHGGQPIEHYPSIVDFREVMGDG